MRQRFHQRIDLLFKVTRLSRLRFKLVVGAGWIEGIEYAIEPPDYPAVMPVAHDGNIDFVLIQRARLETCLQLFIKEIRKPVRILAGGPPVGLAPDLVHVDAHIAVSDGLQSGVPLMLVRIDAGVIEHFRVETLETNNLHQSAVERAQRMVVVVRVQAKRKFARGVQISRIILV
ncbi:hypothetical protein [Paraburkholderia fungorum]|uniref:hypothetical protein n=1 Tax=Paraburkholderia fungorum TaxID=134537 RepID=UPI002092F522|nr:hypothetical protein [Paraburkholderia fungorum]USU18494.1 hypothetical protein NFE55_22775 [Paraburkholderia fungorum]USU26443.1 hypothetical protein NFS19_22190 [Paraburkholderia fungorum]